MADEILAGADTPDEPLRILAVADVWEGSNAYAFVRAFRRMGHSVSVLPPENFVPSAWRSAGLKALRRLAEPLLVREYAQALVEEAVRLRPHLFFVFKGRYVHPDAVARIRDVGCVAVNFFPDVSFLAHGKYIPRALPLYDWIFSTKTFGIADLDERLGVRHASFLAHGFDPEVHRPRSLTEEERGRYECDVSFIGTWSPKKQRVIEHLASALPDVKIRVWGSQWEQARPTLGGRVEGRHVLGAEYAKAIVASRINLAILSEARTGSSSGDRITSRTFHIPATGAFMLHERTDELLEQFDEGVECGCFESNDDLVEKVTYFLDRASEREAIAAAGSRRCQSSGYSIDSRASTIMAKVADLRARRGVAR
jgi:hypothetical protein